MFSPLDITNILLIIVVFLIALSFHEAAHAFTAYRLGDITPKTEGRLTLNPLSHLDIFGTIAIFIFQFGWGKPVQVNPSAFQNPRRDMMLVALAGPTANFLLAFIAAGASSFFISFFENIVFLDNIFFQFLQFFLWINILLGVFNLIPLPPLDGSSVLLGLLPKHLVPPVHYFFQIHGQILFFVLLAVNIVFHIPIITGPVFFLSEKIALFYQIIFAF
jgi:Zn-dependent protease